MKTINLLIILTSLFTAACDNSDNPTPQDQTPALEQEIQELIQPIIDDGASVGASIGIFNNGEKDMYFFGAKEIDGEKPNENTLYEIGSITKTMTSTILAQMVLDQKIKLNDPVQSVLPSGVVVPSYNEQQITFTHLANHTSSLPNIPDNYLNENFDETDPLANYTPDMLFEFLNGLSLSNEIGSKEEYSNIGYGLLGYALTQIDEKPIRTLFSEYIFEELNMSNTLTEITAENIDLAQPHDGNLSPVKPWSFTEATFGAAGVLSTVPDMLNYVEANLGGINTQLNNAFELAHQNTQTLNAPVGKGLAWVNYPHQTENETLTWHDGGTAGTLAFVGFIKERNIGVVLFFNTELDERLGQQLMALQLGVKIIDAIKQHQ